MKDAGIIKVPVLKKTESKTDGQKKGKPAAGGDKGKEEEKKEPVEEVVAFTADDCSAAISSVSSFETHTLGYFEFLECLIRIAVNYKSNAEWEAIHTSAT